MQWLPSRLAKNSTMFSTQWAWMRNWLSADIWHFSLVASMFENFNFCKHFIWSSSSNYSHVTQTWIVSWSTCILPCLSHTATRDMIPILHLNIILTYMRICTKFLRIRRCRRMLLDQKEEIELISINNRCSDIILNWLQIINAIFRLFKVRQRKKRLVKPYFLIRLVAGYR